MSWWVAEKVVWKESKSAVHLVLLSAALTADWMAWNLVAVMEVTRAEWTVDNSVRMTAEWSVRLLGQNLAGHLGRTMTELSVLT